ncbi:polysaccharide deacetylase [Ruminococcaceae bacterium OttesenSCG-928-N02]|nr:polysaccharide deacetylase [Ruminococcaceae bacterium OttesenSCG-928-N02]
MYQLLRFKRLQRWAFFCFLLFFAMGFMRIQVQNEPLFCKPDVFTQGTIPAPIQNNHVRGLTEPDLNEPMFVYLTFDDGPSKTTERVLDILAEYDVHATFFVVTNQTDDYHYLFQRMVDEGHTIALHSHTHSYSNIYQSCDAFFDDLDLASDIIYNACGMRPTVFRFPGGSSNSVCKKHGGSGIMRRLLEEANRRGLTYVDWNVSAEDATGTRYSASSIAQRVIRDTTNHSQAVVLMHDTRRSNTTAEALPSIIEALLEEGYIFDTVDNLAQPVQHIKPEASEPV